MRVALQNFTGGEVAPTLSARYDLSRYHNCVACMENMLPGLHGDVSRRPGTRFLADLGGRAVLIPFSFSAEAGQNFALVFGEKSLRIADADGLHEALGAVLRTRYGQMVEHVIRAERAEKGPMLHADGMIWLPQDLARAYTRRLRDLLSELRRQAVEARADAEPGTPFTRYSFVTDLVPETRRGARLELPVERTPEHDYREYELDES